MLSECNIELFIFFVRVLLVCDFLIVCVIVIYVCFRKNKWINKLCEVMKNVKMINRYNIGFLVVKC